MVAVSAPPSSPAQSTWPLPAQDVSIWCEIQALYAKGCIPTSRPPQLPDGEYMRPPDHPDELRRRRALYRYGILKSTLPKDAFDHLTDLAHRLFNTSMCAVSLVDDTYQWFASEVGLGCSSTTRDVSFCGHAILSKPTELEDVFVVLDATKDWRFMDNPLVTGTPHIRFYAGAKLVDPDSNLPLGNPPWHSHVHAFV